MRIRFRQVVGRSKISWTPYLQLLEERMLQEYQIEDMQQKLFSVQLMIVNLFMLSKIMTHI